MLSGGTILFGPSPMIIGLALLASDHVIDVPTENLQTARKLFGVWRFLMNLLHHVLRFRLQLGRHFPSGLHELLRRRIDGTVRCIGFPRPPGGRFRGGGDDDRAPRWNARLDVPALFAIFRHLHPQLQHARDRIVDALFVRVDLRPQRVDRDGRKPLIASAGFVGYNEFSVGHETVLKRLRDLVGQRLNPTDLNGTGRRSEYMRSTFRRHDLKPIGNPIKRGGSIFLVRF